MKKQIQPFDLAGQVLKRNLIIAVKNEEQVNIMTLGWKTLGTLWGLPVWIVAVKPSRHTYELLNNTNEFTIHAFPRNRADIINTAGSISGRNTDKIKELNLTLQESKYVSTPLIEEAEISYECKIIHTAESGDITDHRLYFGEILATYADQDLLNND